MPDQLGPMPELATTVFSPIANKTHAAVMFACHCGSIMFSLFRLMGHPHDHIHRQCAACGASYCPGGACPDAPAWAEVDPAQPLLPQIQAAAEKDGYLGVSVQPIDPPPGAEFIKPPTTN